MSLCVCISSALCVNFVSGAGTARASMVIHTPIYVCIYIYIHAHIKELS